MRVEAFRQGGLAPLRPPGFGEFSLPCDSKKRRIGTCSPRDYGAARKVRRANPSTEAKTAP